MAEEAEKNAEPIPEKSWEERELLPSYVDCDLSFCPSMGGNHQNGKLFPNK